MQRSLRSRMKVFFCFNDNKQFETHEPIFLCTYLLLILRIMLTNIHAYIYKNIGTYYIRLGFRFFLNPPPFEDNVQNYCV